MKRSIAVAKVISIAMLFIAVGCRSGRAKGTFVISDIKGDSLGMSLEQYMRKHPDSHCNSEDPACIDVAGTTYAGVGFNKSASFTNGKLYDLTYFGSPEFNHDQVLTALKEKYGEPRCATSENNTQGCDWWNGSMTIRFLSSADGVSVRFTLDDLAAAAAQKAEAKQAHDRKTDQ
jgi:hypothetical protein